VFPDEIGVSFKIAQSLDPKKLTNCPTASLTATGGCKSLSGFGTTLNIFPACAFNESKKTRFAMSKSSPNTLVNCAFAPRILRIVTW
jgi:hypothetical protein